MRRSNAQKADGRTFTFMPLGGVHSKSVCAKSSSVKVTDSPRASARAKACAASHIRLDICPVLALQIIIV